MLMTTPTQQSQENKEIQKRQVAKILRIVDLLSGEYVQQSGWLPNFVRTKDGIEASRVNIIGALTDISPTDIVPLTPIENFSATLDDGSGKMQLRSFEPIVFADVLQVGIPVIVIARPKKYSGDLFLVPEIIRKLPESKWLEVRKKVLEQKTKSAQNPDVVPTAKESRIQTVQARKENSNQSTPNGQMSQKGNFDNQNEIIPLAKVAVEEAGNAQKIQAAAKPLENVLDVIDRIDSGDGVLIEDAVAQIKKSRPELDAQQRILTLLLNGDLFEIRPGRIKVLK